MVKEQQDALCATIAISDHYARCLGERAFVAIDPERMAQRIDIARMFRAALRALFSDIDHTVQTMNIDQFTDKQRGLEAWLPGRSLRNELVVILESTCDSCCLPLEKQDLLGRECYALGPFSQLCDECYDLLCPVDTYVSRRLSRLMAAAPSYKDRLLPMVASGLMHLRWDIDDALAALAINEAQLLQLALYPAIKLNDPYHWQMATSALAVALPCQVDGLRQLLVAAAAHSSHQGSPKA